MTFDTTRCRRELHGKSGHWRAITLAQACDEIDRLRQALDDAIAALIAERDSFYDGATTVEGSFDHPDDERACAEMDARIDRLQAARHGGQGAAP